FLITTVIRKLFFHTDYDDQAMQGAMEGLKRIEIFGRLPTNQRLLNYCIESYYWIPVSIVAIISFYIIKRNWAKLSFFILFVAGYILLINTSYAYADATDSYMENLYLPLGVLLAIPVVFDVLPIIPKSTGYILVALIALTGAYRIFQMHPVYT